MQQHDLLGTYHEGKHLFWLTVIFGFIVAIPLVFSLVIDHPVAQFGGGMVSLIITLGYGYEMWKQIRLFDLYAEQVRSRIQIANPPPATVSAQPIKVIRETVNDAGYARQSIREYPNPPDREFIKWVFDEVQLSKEKRVPGERAIEKSRWGEDGDEWMDNLVEQGFVEFVNSESPKQGRRWVSGKQLDEALARFGHYPMTEKSA